MPANTTAELHPDAVRAERAQAQQHLRIMIESMVRAGYSEPEITQAVKRSTAPEGTTAGASGGLWNQLRGLFQV
jgi:hypothetical protein